MWTSQTDAYYIHCMAFTFLCLKPVFNCRRLFHITMALLPLWSLLIFSRRCGAAYFRPTDHVPSSVHASIDAPKCASHVTAFIAQQEGHNRGVNDIGGGAPASINSWRIGVSTAPLRKCQRNAFHIQGRSSHKLTAEQH